MQRIYSVLRPPIDKKSYADWITKCDQKLSVSSTGLIAFSSSFCLKQTCPNYASYRVYVADINAPYQPYLLVESEHEFTIIEWDPSGKNLLLCDSRGCLSIFTSQDFLISEWKPFLKHTFSAETFITAVWYHRGVISTINIANQNLKQPSNHLEYFDKIKQEKFGPSLRLFGRPAEGCFLISRSGLICCITLMADGTADITTESLGPLRSKIEIADICHCKDGSFIVASSCGSINSTISFRRVCLSMKGISVDDADANFRENQRVKIVCEQFSSFHLNVMSQILTERENTCAFERISHIKFVTRTFPHDVLVEISGKNLSLVELWELEAIRPNPIHNAIIALMGDKKPNINVTNNSAKSEENGLNQDTTTKEWTFKGNYITDRDLITIQTPKFRLFGQNRQTNVILLAYRDSTVCCLRMDDLQPIVETSLTTYCEVNTHSTNSLPSRDSKATYRLQHKISNLKQYAKAHPSKDTTSNYITNLQISPNQTLFIAIDTMSRLHVARLPTLFPCRDPQDEETYLQYILEYALVTRNDWWDVLVCAKSETLEKICDKFYDAFERQPKHIQRTYFSRQLMIRGSLYRCINSPTSLCKSSDCHSMIMLGSIASTLKSILGSQDTNRELQNSPAEALTKFLRGPGIQPAFFNIDAVISKLNDREFYVETELSQCLQPLIQWVTEFAIFLIASIPQRARRPESMLPGAGLTSNKEALETIREVLIIIRIWGEHNNACLPCVFKLSTQVDIIASLFKLISTCCTSIGSEYNKTFLDECVNFTNMLSVPRFSYLLAAQGVASPLLYSTIKSISNNNGASQPAQYPIMEFFQEPMAHTLVPLDRIECSIDMHGKRKMDVVRNISLGAYSIMGVRHCTRCKSVSLIKPPGNGASIWESGWVTNCVCGGSWAVPPVSLTHPLIKTAQ